MATAVMMPRQGQSVETCFITSWHKAKGDKIEKGDILFSYETDKAAFDEEAPESGVLLEIFFGEGDEVPVLETVAVIGQPGEKYTVPATGKAASAGKPADGHPGASADGPRGASAEVFPGKPVGMTPGEPADAKGEPEEIPPGKPGSAREDTTPEGRIRISPLARKLATAHNLSLANIKGSGPQGRIIERDIKKAAGNKKPMQEQAPEEPMVRSEDGTYYKAGVPAEGTDSRKEKEFVLHKLTNMRRIIARKMEESLQNSAQLTHHMSADARKMLAWRKEIKAEKGNAGVDDISINDMVCYAVIRALKNMHI
jgi:pyruvate dehydrogenase E2 component (dihydrolipoamide acetyltransferase)